MEEEYDSLVARRSRRSTAGNRLEAVLAEVSLQPAQDPRAEEEEDIDFVHKDEEDQFGSDFADTDEEAASEDGNVQEQTAKAAVIEEERTARKEARERRERATRAAATRQRVTFDPEAHAAALRRSDDNSPPKRRGRPRKVPAEADPSDEGKGKGKEAVGVRAAFRKTTVARSKASKQKEKEHETRQAAQQRRVKQVARELTQDEYIARALEMEEGNILEHRNYLVTEEEKRRRAKVVRPAVQGPLVRWVSKIEEEVVPLVQSSDNSSGSSRQGSSAVLTLLSLSAVHKEPAQPGSSASALMPAAPAFVIPPSALYPIWPPSTDNPTAPAAGPSTLPTVASAPPLTPEMPMSPAQVNPPMSPMQIDPPFPSDVSLPTVRVTKNYVVHELDQVEGTRKPKWKETMRALFGDHVRWEALKVYTGAGRPLSQPVETCPLTGLPARYKDPRTGVAFADARAYQTLTAVLGHEYVWSENMGCYVDRRGPVVDTSADITEMDDN